MTPPRTTRWAIEPHTQAKHLILRRYLEAWLPIMSRWNGRIHIFDGFAGPGRYAGGEEGSPIIAVRTLLNHPQFQTPTAGREVVFNFVESDHARVASLRGELDAIARPAWAKVHTTEGEFADVMTGMLDHMDSQATRIAPTFAFIDPFGFAEVPMAVIARLMANSRCECLISFMFESVNRFLSHPNPNIQAHMDVLFGTTAWRQLLTLPPAARRDGLVALYAGQLKSVAGATYVRTFEMINEGNRTEYYLFFITNRPEGLSKMKQAMWTADPVDGEAFSDRTDAQGTLLGNDTYDPTELSTLLTNRYRDAGLVSIDEVARFVLEETPFSEAIHLKRRTLAPMERGGSLQVTRPAGKRNIPGQYPPGTRLRFV